MRYQQRASPPPGDDPLEFVMSDGSVDRLGDVIEPDGWQLGNFRKSPIALFNHDRDQVIGQWRDVAVREGRLTGRLELAEQGTSALVDTIRALVRQKILRAVSVGFRALKSEKLTEEASEWGGPFRFLKSELLECSLVSVPANSNALAIAKAFPRDVVAEVFRKPANENPDRAAAPHGKPATSLVQKSTNMTLTQQIQNAQQRINNLRDQGVALANKDQANFDDDERKQFDQIPGLLEAEQAELERLERMEKAIAPRNGNGAATTKAGFAPAPLTGEVMTPSDLRSFALPKKKIEAGDFVIRAMAVGIRAFGTQVPLEHALREMYGNDEGTQIILRAAVNPAMTTVAGYAAELVQTANGSFMDRLIANSIYGPLSMIGGRFDLGRNGSLKIPTRANTPRAAGAWVGEGAPKPVKKIGLTSVTLTPHKLAVITTFTEEMALYSVPAIEGLLRKAMMDDTREALDGFLIDDVAASASRPAGLLNGVTPITPAATGTTIEKIVADINGLIAPMEAVNGGGNVVMLMNPAQARQIGMAQTTTGDFAFGDTAQAQSKFGISRIIVSTLVPAGTIIAIDADWFATVTGDAPRFAVSNEATLHEEDTTPLPLNAGTPANPMRSLFQTDSIAIRLSLYVSWSMVRAGMVQVVEGVTW